MKKVIRLTESDLVKIVKKIINEQDMGKFSGEGSGDTQKEDFDHFNEIVKPQLIKKGFRFDYDKNLVQYGTENSLIYGTHSTGINVVWHRKKGNYSVWKGVGKEKEFQLGGSNDSRSVANNVVKYASSL